MRNILFRKKEATVIENMLVSMISLVMVCAFLVIVFGAFSSINDKWSMRQAARETLLIMETEGYLKPEDEQALLRSLVDMGFTISILPEPRKRKWIMGIGFILRSRELMMITFWLLQVGSQRWQGTELHLPLSVRLYGKAVRRTYVGEERSRTAAIGCVMLLYHGDYHGYTLHSFYCSQCKAYDDPA